MSHANHSFQSSPGPKTGCNAASISAPVSCRLILVSILTRPEDRVQRNPRCYGTAAVQGFNPHPARRPGATPPPWCVTTRRPLVSILTRPEDRVQQTQPSDMFVEVAVSILTRPEDRVQLRDLPTETLISLLVSILTRPEDRVQRAEKLFCIKDSRNVSILTRPEDRVQPAARVSAYGPNHPVSILTRPEDRVQRRHELGLPGRRALSVSILTRPEDRVQQGALGVKFSVDLFQSSPGPKTGCNLEDAA